MISNNCIIEGGGRLYSENAAACQPQKGSFLHPFRRSRAGCGKKQDSSAPSRQERDSFRAICAAKRWYVRLLRAHGILLDPGCCIMVVPDYDEELLDAVFADLDRFAGSRFHFREGRFRRIAFLYADGRLARYIQQVQGIDVLSLCCAPGQLRALLRAANFFYLDTRIKIISLDEPFGRRGSRLLASGKVSKADLARYALPGRYRGTDISSLRFLFLGGSAIAFVKDTLIPAVSFLVRLLPWDVFERLCWHLVLARGRKLFCALGGGTGLLAVCPYRGTGDVYLAMSFLARYAAEKQLPPPAVCVQGKGCAEIASLFMQGKVVPLGVCDMLCLTRYIFFRESPEEEVLLLHQSPPLFWHDIFEFVRNLNGLNFHDMHRYVLFGGLAGHPALPSFRGESALTQPLFRRNGLREGRTVLLAPSARTLPDLPASFWRALALRLRAAGWDVALNCQRGSKSLADTVPLCVPYAVLVPFVERAGAFIGIRSGLCEVVSSARCRKIIVYPRKRQGAGSAKDFFSLRAMGLSPDACELEYSGTDTADAILRLLGGTEEEPLC